MSRLSDSRDPNGVGILILQHPAFQEKKFSLDLRGSILAARVLDRDDDKEGLGSWTYDPDAAGDITNALCWLPKNPAIEAGNLTRKIAGWSWAWAAIGIDPDNSTPTPGPGAVCSMLKKWKMSPVRGDKMEIDPRYEPIDPKFPVSSNGKRLWPKFPKNYYGIAVTASNEEKQIEYFMPTDPRLIAVQRRGDVAMGTFVCDMGDAFEIDENRMARLQSKDWVIKKPVCCAPDFAGENTIAWNIGPTGCGDAYGGLVIDLPKGEGTSTITSDPKVRLIAHISQRASGPIEVGSAGDKHFLGLDADGRIINSAHLSADAYIHRNNIEDGPLNLTGWIQGDVFEKPAMVWCGFNGRVPHSFACGTKAGKWDWYTTVPDYLPRIPPWDPDGEDEPPDRPNTPTGTPTPTGGTPNPTGGNTITPLTLPQLGIEDPQAEDVGESDRDPTDAGKFRPGSSIPTVRALAIPGQLQRYLARISDSAFGSLLARPQMIVTGIPDLRKTTSGVGPLLMNRNDAAAPIVARMEPWGQQLGGQWIYTDSPRKSRFVGGTADGGWMIMPPEYDMADDANSFAPPGRTASATYFSVLAGSYFGAGFPDLTTGALKTAYRWGANTSGVLLFDQVNSSGTVTANVLSLDNNARVGVNTAAPATTFHVATTSVRIDLTNDALGAGAAATLGNIGGSGPTRDAQDSWARINMNGTTYWLPLWI